MKMFRVRKPNFKRMIKARTTGRLKRSLKKLCNPFYEKKGMGFLKSPKKSIKNKIYKKTTIDPLKMFKKLIFKNRR